MSATNALVEFTVAALPLNKRIGRFECVEHGGAFAKELKDFVQRYRKCLDPNDRLEVRRPDGSLFLEIRELPLDQR